MLIHVTGLNYADSEPVKRLFTVFRERKTFGWATV